jgi:SAM-dependent methyltransferase
MATFARVDESDDRLFYQQPRLVQHIDDGFIRQLQGLLREVLPSHADVLDLMSSWVSHIPTDLKLGRVVGLGMNGVELAANPQLQTYTVQSLNENPILPYQNGEFDAVLITVSIQYVTRPFELIPEIGRVLKPGGTAVISFSNRMFPTKAVAIWRESSDADHLKLVQHYFEKAGVFTDITQIHKTASSQNNPLSWFLSPGDPFYAVVAKKTS